MEPTARRCADSAPASQAAGQRADRPQQGHPDGSGISTHCPVLLPMVPELRVRKRLPVALWIFTLLIWGIYLDLVMKERQRSS